MPQISLQAISCWGNPVPIVSTPNPDGSINIAVGSDVSISPERMFTTLPSQSQTMANLLSAETCVLNIPPKELAPAVVQLMRTTGSRERAAACQGQGLRYTRAKFFEADLTPCRSIVIATAGVEECPIRVEAELVRVRCYPDTRLQVVELRALRIHADTTIMKVGSQHKVDLEKWQPLQAGSQELFRHPVGDEEARNNIDISFNPKALGLRQARILAKSKGSQARHPVIAASASITSLRAVYEIAEPIANERCDDTHVDAREANAFLQAPSDSKQHRLDSKQHRLDSNVLLEQPHTFGLFLRRLLFLVCR
ncbi:MAG: hypothetical protein Q9168_000586 [Polycauliona sp. 1 TL-2023]